MSALDRISVAAIGNSVAELEAETLRAEANAHAFGDAGWHREQVAAALL